MAGNKVGAQKMRAKLIARFGSEEKYKEHMRLVGGEGGRAYHSSPRGFAANVELARKAGAIGGTISRRKKKVLDK